jgi:hypothetical protein
MPIIFQSNDDLVEQLLLDSFQSSKFLIQFDEPFDTTGNVVFFRKHHVQTYFKGHYRIINDPIESTINIRLSVENHTLTFNQNRTTINQRYLNCDVKDLTSYLESLTEITKDNFNLN